MSGKSNNLPAAQAKPGWDITPRTMEEATKFAKLIADSDLAPKDYKGKPGNVLIACQMGGELGLKPIQAIQNIAVINGRPAVWGDAIVGLVQGSGKLEAFKEDFDDKTMTATCKVKRTGKDWTVVTFSKADAEKAGLWKKQGPWQQYPKRMLQLRARGFAMRDAFADVLKGLQLVEEARDIPSGAIDVVPEPAAKPEPAAAPEPQPKEQPAAEQQPDEGKTNDDIVLTIEIAKVTASEDEHGAVYKVYDVDGHAYPTRSKELAQVAKAAKKNGHQAKITLRDGALVMVNELATANA